MCGTLKHNDQRFKLGDQVTAREYRTGAVITSRWSGFIKQEKLDWWLQQSQLKPVEVKVHSFIEGRNEFEVPSHHISGYQLLSDVQCNGKVIGKAGEIKLLTRAPVNTFERAVHDRWPVVKVGKNRKLFAFQPWDVKGLTSARQMDLPMTDAAE